MKTTEIMLLYIYFFFLEMPVNTCKKCRIIKS